ncbi:MAG: hypothetical protein CL902_00400, partial [Dehalococcoidia bacterium]|nr:hypothetical protein [Dehalococcoidia bacterium]
TTTTARRALLLELRRACFQARTCYGNPDLLDTTAACQRVLDNVTGGALFGTDDRPSNYHPADVYTSDNFHELRRLTW